MAFVCCRSPIFFGGVEATTPEELAAAAGGGADGGAAAALGDPGPRAAAEACPCQPWVAKIAEEFVAHLLASRT